MTDSELAEIENVFGYHAGTDETIPKHEEVRAAFRAFAKIVYPILPDGKAKTIFKNKLQEASMFANFAIAETAPIAPAPVNEPTLF